MISKLHTDVTTAFTGLPIAQTAIDTPPSTEKTAMPLHGMRRVGLTAPGEVRLTLTTEIKEPA